MDRAARRTVSNRRKPHATSTSPHSTPEASFDHQSSVSPDLALSSNTLQTAPQSRRGSKALPHHSFTFSTPGSQRTQNLRRRSRTMENYGLADEDFDEDSPKKGGHSLRKRARVDYTFEHIDDEVVVPNSTTSARGKKRRSEHIYDFDDAHGHSAKRRGNSLGADTPSSRRRNPSRKSSELMAYSENADEDNNDVQDTIEVGVSLSDMDSSEMRPRSHSNASSPGRLNAAPQDFPQATAQLDGLSHTNTHSDTFAEQKSEHDAVPSDAPAVPVVSESIAASVEDAVPGPGEQLLNESSGAQSGIHKTDDIEPETKKPDNLEPEINKADKVEPDTKQVEAAQPQLEITKPAVAEPETKTKVEVKSEFTEQNQVVETEIRKPTEVQTEIQEGDQVQPEVKAPEEIQAETQEVGQAQPEAKELDQAPADVKQPEQIQPEIEKPEPEQLETKQLSEAQLEIKKPNEAEDPRESPQQPALAEDIPSTTTEAPEAPMSDAPVEAVQPSTSDDIPAAISKDEVENTASTDVQVEEKVAPAEPEPLPPQSKDKKPEFVAAEAEAPTEAGVSIQERTVMEDAAPQFLDISKPDDKVNVAAAKEPEIIAATVAEPIEPVAEPSDQPPDQLPDLPSNKPSKEASKEPSDEPFTSIPEPSVVSGPAPAEAMDIDLPQTAVEVQQQPSTPPAHSEIKPGHDEPRVLSESTSGHSAELVQPEATPVAEEHIASVEEPQTLQRAVMGRWAHLTPYIEGEYISYPEKKSLSEDGGTGDDQANDEKDTDKDGEKDVDKESNDMEPMVEDNDDVPDITMGDAPTPALNTPTRGSPVPESVEPTAYNSPAPGLEEADEADVSESQEPPEKSRYFSYPKLRDAEEYISALENYEEMSTADLYEMLEAINGSLAEWQDEWAGLGRVVDDYENSLRRRLADGKYESRTRNLNQHGINYEEPDFVVKGYKAKEKELMSETRYLQSQDRIMAATYGFEYDPHPSKIGRQNPETQQVGIMTRGRSLRNQPRQTAKATETDEVTGKRQRKPVLAFDPAPAQDISRSSTPVPTRGRRRRNVNADNDDIQPTANSSFNGDANSDDDVLPKTRRKRGPRAKAAIPIIAEDLIAAEESNARDESGRPGRRGRVKAPVKYDDSLAYQYAEEDLQRDELHRYDPQLEEYRREDRKREDRKREDRKREGWKRESHKRDDHRFDDEQRSEANHVSRRMLTLKIPNMKHFSEPSSAITNNGDSRPSTAESVSSSHTAESSYSFRPKRQKRFRDEPEDNEIINQPPPKKRGKRNTGDDIVPSIDFSAMDVTPNAGQRKTPKIKVVRTGFDSRNDTPSSIAPPDDGDETPKDYKSMTKSEKMSASMKSRWANGNMAGAVEKRKATLAAKKAAQAASETKVGLIAPKPKVKPTKKSSGEQGEQPPSSFTQRLPGMGVPFSTN